MCEKYWELACHSCAENVVELFKFDIVRSIDSNNVITGQQDTRTTNAVQLIGTRNVYKYIFSL